MRDEYGAEDFPAGLRRRYRWRARWFLFTRPRIRPGFAWALQVAIGFPAGWWSDALWDQPWLFVPWLLFAAWTGSLLGRLVKP